MEEIKITDEYLNDIREQFKKWADFLNMSFGLISFTLALTCLGTKSPVINAWLCLIVVSFIRIKGSNIFPEEILRLRKASKTDEKSRIIYNGLTNEFLSLKALFKGYIVFLLGFLLLSLIAFSPFLDPVFPFLKNYIGN